MIDEVHRVALIEELLQMARPISEVARALSNLEWDYEGEGVTLAKHHLTSVLERFLLGELDASEVERWANLVEGRDDVDISTAGRHALDALHELANPLLTQALSVERARTLVSLLTTS